MIDKAPGAAPFDQLLENPGEDPFGGSASDTDVTFADSYRPPTDSTDRYGESYLRRLDLELKEGAFGQADIEDFSDFNNVGRAVEDGKYSFTAESKFLKQAASILNEIGGAEAVRVTVFPDRLKLAAANTAAFVETLIPTVVNPAVKLPADETVAFILEKRKLIAMAQSLRRDAMITFEYLAQRRNLIIRGDDGVLNYPTLEVRHPPDYHNNCGIPKLLGELDPAALREAIRFLTMYVIRDDLQQNLSVIDFHPAAPALPRDAHHTETGRGVTGSASAIGVYDCTRLPRVPLRIRYNVVNVAAQLLARFHPERTRLFRAGNFFLLRDQNLYLGFDATDYSFPAVEQILAARADSHILIPREELDRHLLQLSIVNSDASTPVRWLLAGVGNSASLILEVSDIAGRVSHCALTVARRANDEFVARGGRPADLPDLDFTVNLAALKSTIAYSKTAHVLLEFIGNALRIIAATADAQAIAMLTVLNKGAASRQRGS